MGGVNGTITVETSSYRPCIVKGRKALFHRWEEKSTLHVGGKAIRTIDVDVPSGYIQFTVAIIEYEDGSAHECYPDEIKFCDNKIMEYAFTKEGAK